MKPILAIAVAVLATFGGATGANAQSITSAPSDGSTGPTVPDNRTVDRGTIAFPVGISAAPSSTINPSSRELRTSSGLNVDLELSNSAPDASSSNGATR
ncbi:hypothetical protein BH10PSE6_BH10PSE6_57150 [soil metagenome]